MRRLGLRGRGWDWRAKVGRKWIADMQLGLLSVGRVARTRQYE